MGGPFRSIIIGSGGGSEKVKAHHDAMYHIMRPAMDKGDMRDMRWLGWEYDGVMHLGQDVTLEELRATGWDYSGPVKLYSEWHDGQEPPEIRPNSWSHLFMDENGTWWHEAYDIHRQETRHVKGSRPCCHDAED